MNRRDFVAASLGTSLLPSDGGAAEAAASPQLLELRRYQFRFGSMEARWSEYAKNALVPAMNRAGVKPVGAFSVAVGNDAPAAYLLIPHPSAASVAGLGTKIRTDEAYAKDAAAFRALPANDPPYVRRSSQLLVAFDSVPAVEVPSGPLAAPSRVFELRTYESHNETAGFKKIEMFEKGGEIAIFRRVGLVPVFFGRAVVGDDLPSLTYMVAFADMAGREKGWATFRDDPEWLKLRAMPGYGNAEILTNITSTLLRPLPFSQI